MKIEFKLDKEGYQSAHKLRLILGHYSEIESDQGTQELIESLSQQIDEFLANEEFDRFRESVPSPETGPESRQDKSSFLDYLSSFWQLLAGPSRRELALSKQRKELIERAEHAETIAFEALAETADMGKERDSVLKQLKELEQELAILKETT